MARRKTVERKPGAPVTTPIEETPRRHFKDIEEFKNYTHLVLEFDDIDILFYTFVNHKASQSRFLSDINEATMLPLDDIMRKVHNLISLGYIAVIPRASASLPVYVNTIYIEDITGLDEYPSVKYYLAKNKKTLISKSEDVVRAKRGI